MHQIDAPRIALRSGNMWGQQMLAEEKTVYLQAYLSLCYRVELAAHIAFQMGNILWVYIQERPKDNSPFAIPPGLCEE